MQPPVAFDSPQLPPRSRDSQSNENGDDSAESVPVARVWELPGWLRCIPPDVRFGHGEERSTLRRSPGGASPR
jgi:hypothetical protein